MNKENQIITDKYAIYEGDCCEILPQIPDSSIHMSCYSPPFFDVYSYTGFDNDLANCMNYEEFLEHYEFVVKEIARVTMPGRMSCVQCMDIPLLGDGGLLDMPGDFVRLHKKYGMKYWDRHCIWNEPLTIRLKTMSNTLKHQTLCVDDSAKCRGALADYLLVFKKAGENKVPVVKPHGLTEFIGDLKLLPEEERKEYEMLVKKYVGWEDDLTNKLSQWLWRHFASSFWLDIRKNRVLPYKPARDKGDDRHVCPMPLDIADRAAILWTNPGEKILTPFMGTGTEVYSAVDNDRFGIGMEIKSSYFRQAAKNLDELVSTVKVEQPKLIEV